jgi:hypothetical protein
VTSIFIDEFPIGGTAHEPVWVHRFPHWETGMIRRNSGADSIVWIEEGTAQALAGFVWIHAPKTFVVFGLFIGCDSAPLAWTVFCFYAPEFDSL